MRHFAVYSNRNFWLTWSAMLASRFGSTLLTLAFAAHVYFELEDAVRTASIFVVDWAVTLLVVFAGAPQADRADARRFLIRLDLAAAGVTGLFVFCLSPSLFPLALLVLGMRSFLMKTMLAARMRAMFQFFDKEQRDLFTPVINSGYYLALGLAGVTGVMLLAETAMPWVVAVDVATFLLSAVLFALVRPVAGGDAAPVPKGPLGHHLRTTLTTVGETLRTIPSLADAVFYIIVVAGFFQGTFEVLIISLPQQWFELEHAGAAAYYTLFSLGTLAGALVYQYLKRRHWLGNERGTTAVAALSACMLYLAVAFSANSVLLNAMCFLAMIVCFEAAWTHQLTRIVRYAPENVVARVTAVQNAVGYCFMALVALAAGALINRVGMAPAILLTVGCFALTCSVWELRHRFGPRRPAVSLPRAINDPGV